VEELEGILGVMSLAIYATLTTEGGNVRGGENLQKLFVGGTQRRDDAGRTLTRCLFTIAAPVADLRSWLMRSTAGRPWSG